VSDDGRGIPPDEVNRIFEPFFTRKRLGESSGSGLGLAIVHGVVKEHDGFVNVESALERGTTFSLYFMRSDTSAVARDDPRDGARSAKTCAGRILVVDDDPVQVRTAQRVLEHEGHQVTTARGGREVQLVFEDAARSGEPSPYDLLILDMVLNEVDDGLEIFERIVRLYPRQRALIVSGHAPTTRGLLAVERGLAWLSKPYTREALVQAVGTALTQTGSHSLYPPHEETPPNSSTHRRTGT